MDKYIVVSPAPPKPAQNRLILDELKDDELSDTSGSSNETEPSRRPFVDFIEIHEDADNAEASAAKIHRADVRDVLNERVRKPKKRETVKVETDEDMLKYLEGYEETDDTSSLPYLTQLRYITFRDGVPKFSLGGYLVSEQGDRLLMTSAHRRFCWTVLKEHMNPMTNEPYEKTRFFKKLTPTDILAYQTEHDLASLRSRVAELEATVQSLQASLNEVNSIVENSLLSKTPRRRKVAPVAEKGIKK